eukprot:TRINITY_DN936_c0_g2_i1.p1 TRINITY_DN936_c0_g2~~TRINITY_DN936_c0_g2_i1.p1  ORF type:complete len:459 (+),score=50.34 TRINITY_DN936_c0_g2_i1:97-1473(+)
MKHLLLFSVLIASYTCFNHTDQGVSIISTKNHSEILAQCYGVGISISRPIGLKSIVSGPVTIIKDGDTLENYDLAGTVVFHRFRVDELMSVLNYLQERGVVGLVPFMTGFPDEVTNEYPGRIEFVLPRKWTEDVDFAIVDIQRRCYEAMETLMYNNNLLKIDFFVELKSTINENIYIDACIYRLWLYNALLYFLYVPLLYFAVSTYVKYLRGAKYMYDNPFSLPLVISSLLIRVCISLIDTYPCNRIIPFTVASTFLTLPEGLTIASFHISVYYWMRYVANRGFKRSFNPWWTRRKYSLIYLVLGISCLVPQIILGVLLNTIGSTTELYNRVYAMNICIYTIIIILSFYIWISLRSLYSAKDNPGIEKFQSCMTQYSLAMMGAVFFIFAKVTLSRVGTDPMNKNKVYLMAYFMELCMDASAVVMFEAGRKILKRRKVYKSDRIFIASDSDRDIDNSSR